MNEKQKTTILIIETVGSIVIFIILLTLLVSMVVTYF
jgi:hypothetical protein